MSILPCVAHAGPAADPAGGPLTLTRALELARAANPSIAASRHELAAARAREQESRRGPAPVLGVTWEDAGGGTAAGRYDLTVAVEQTVELGGDRGSRTALARARQEWASAEWLATRAAIDTDVAEAFFDAVEAQERVQLLRLAEQDAERAVQSAGERLRAGAAPAQEQLRARATWSQRRVERAQAERERQSACARLARSWQGDPQAIERLGVPDVEALEIPGLDSLAVFATRQPEVRRARAELAHAEAELRQLRAARVPDITLGVGLRRFAEPAATGWVATIALPFAGPGTGPAANQSAIASREASAVRAEAGLTGSLATWREQHDRFRSLLDSLRELRTNGMPAADEALRTIEAGFRAGRFNYLDLQDAQRLRLEQRLLELQQAREIGVTWWGLAQLGASDSEVLPTLPEVTR